MSFRLEVLEPRRLFAGVTLVTPGFSRGGSLVSEIAKGLGQHGVWVDELTYLDPHPVNGGSSNFGFNFGDPAMSAYDNVRFIDDYYHLDPGNPFDFSGVSVDGADD